MMKRNSSPKLPKIVFYTSLLGAMAMSEVFAEDSIANKLKNKRERDWKNYLKVGSYSLFVDQRALSNLPYLERRKIINYRNKKWDQILDLYHEADYISVTKKAPNFYPWKTHRAAAAYLSGMSYTKYNQLSSALKSFERSIRYQFTNPQVYFEKGKVLLAMDKLDESYKAFQQSIKRNNKVVLSSYYLGWIRELQDDLKGALEHYDQVMTLPNLDAQTAQSVQIRRAEIYEKISENSQLDTRVRNAILNQKVVGPAKNSIKLDPTTTNAKRLNEFLQKLEQKFNLPSLIPFKVGSMGHYLRLNQYFSYDTNVPGVPDDVSQFRDSMLASSIFVYKHYFSTLKGLTHTPEVRINYATHFETNIPTIYSEDSYTIGPSFRNAYKHKLWGRQSTFVFDLETSYTAKDYNQDKSKEFFNRSIKFNIGENIKFLKFGSTNFKLRQDYRTFFDESLNSKTFTIFVNQLINLQGNRTVSLIANGDFTSADTSVNSTNSYMLRTDYLHPNLIGSWELQTALTFLGTDTQEQSDIRGFETNISYEMEWRRKFFNDFEFAVNYNYMVNSSKDEANFSYDKHLFALELQYIPRF